MSRSTDKNACIMIEPNYFIEINQIFWNGFLCTYLVTHLNIYTSISYKASSKNSNLLKCINIHGELTSVSSCHYCGYDGMIIKLNICTSLNWRQTLEILIRESVYDQVSESSFKWFTN